jgi:hypothetical protein
VISARRKVVRGAVVVLAERPVLCARPAPQSSFGARTAIYRAFGPEVVRERSSSNALLEHDSDDRNGRGRHPPLVCV